MEKLARPRARVDEDIAADAKDSSVAGTDDTIWVGPAGVPMHPTKSDRAATPDVIAEDNQARNPNWDKQTDQYDRITEVGPYQRNPVDLQQRFRFPGTCGFSKPLTYATAENQKTGTGCPTLCGYCTLPPGHEGGHQFRSGDDGSFVGPGWEATATDIVLKRVEQKRAGPPDMTWYRRRRRRTACRYCQSSDGHTEGCPLKW